MVPDEPLVSPRRLFYATRFYFWYRARRAPNEVVLGLWDLWRYHRRPLACARAARLAGKTPNVSVPRLNRRRDNRSASGPSQPEGCQNVSDAQDVS